MVSQGGGGDGIDKQSLKHVLDSIGKIVHDQVKTEAEKYKDELKGNLQHAASTSLELNYTADTCTLVDDYYTKRLNGNNNRHPCKELSGKDVERFSDTLGGQCTREKISGSTNTCGACAPYRRLHLCHHNLESIDTKSTTHKLLAEVCYAAKEEGDSIKTHHPQHQQTNKDSASQLCTVLARSFADIGDIVRGKDLFLGNTYESAQRKQLDDKLKEIFAKIHKEVTSDKNVELQKRYNDDTDNYYKLREDWWTANRHTVWEAITCNAKGYQYFRATCGGDEKTGTQARNQCRCPNGNDQVPTYFDYVPQYLRWFEEWAEDFCRKKKKKLKDVKTNCRDDSKNLYCSGNGYDCTKTIYKKGKLVIGEHCTNCSVWCRLYESWIDNQKKEFLKQKRKYAEEIQKKEDKTTTTITIGDKTINNLYVGDFYEKLEKQYGKVDDFLKLLNKENECKGINEQEEKIDFSNKCDYRFDKNINNKGTFYHSEYCQACPYCGVQREGEGWKKKSETDQCNINLYKPTNGAKGTNIKILKSGENRDDIRKKIDDFCDKTQNGSDGSGDCGGGNSDPSLCEPWKCYQFKQLEKEIKKDGVNDDDYDKDVRTGGGLCILKNQKHESGKNSSNEPEEFQKTFNNFFYFWIGRFLNDSMYWREKVNSCINNPKRKKCKNECKTDCGCFKRWIDKKKTEWDKIVQHFKTQDFGNEGGPLGSLINSPSYVLKEVLNIDELFNNIKSGYGNAKELEGINKMLEKEKKREAEEAEADGNDSQNKTTIDKLLKHEGDEAQECQQKHTCLPPEENLARSEDIQPPQSPSANPTDSAGDEEEEVASSDEEENEEEEDEEEDEKDTVDTAKDSAATEDTKQDGSATDTTTPLDVCATVDKALTGDDLKHACSTKYEKGREKFPNWKCVTPSGDTTTETFFLWHRYKKEKEREDIEKQQRENEKVIVTSDVGKKLQEELQRGKIPDGFLRQMFYTLADYKDILFSGSNDSKKSGYSDIFSGDKEMADREKTIKDAINNYFNSENNKPGGKPGPQNSVEQRKNWWKNHGPDIWNGMIYALTYNTDTPSGTPPQQDTKVKQALLDTNNKPKTKTVNGPDYTYENVVLKEESSGPNAPGSSSPSGGDPINNPKLSDFVLRPPYFRYLEEWGETFCRQRARMLEKIKGDCKVDENGKKQYSGFGEDCDDQLKDDPTTFKDLENASCANSCSSYRKWIKRKRKEYEKQKNAYNEQQKKCQKENNAAEGNNGGNGSCGTLENYKEAKEFLQKLGSCKNNNRNENAEGNKKIFDDDAKTFGPADNCKPCSEFKIDCEKANCTVVEKKEKCNGNNRETTTITAEDINGSTEDIGMVVSDDSTTEFKNGLEACITSGIFQGIKENKWKCGKKIKQKISHCIKNSDGSKCENKCDKKCNCVREWLKKKTTEWKEIKERFNDQYKSNGSHDDNVRSVLEPLLTQIAAANNKKKNYNKLDELKKSLGCNCANHSHKSENSEKSDIIDCMLNKLENLKNIIKTCQNVPSGEEQKPCDVSNPLVEDDDEPFEEENPEENTVEAPKICGEMKEETKEQEEGDCKAAAEETASPAPSEGTEEGVPPPPEKKKPAPTIPKKPPQPQPTPELLEKPHVLTALVTSTLAWSVGIGFAAFTYFYLKKKTKSTIDLLRVINIPKSDYDIPTKRSPNRYIPYTSGKYRGKRYIYLEGDSGTDSGYTDHYSDITSSESEYEELDINDIYVPGSPKYKTLIEVVLEPSGKLSGNTIPTSGKNTPTSNTPSDTQNDIQNDGIPSSKITDNEWNTLKDDFISNMLQNEPNDVPNDYKSGDIPFNTQPNTLYFDNNQEKPFIMSIHDRNLLSGEEYNYNVNMVNSMNDIPINRDNNVYSGIDLINDTLSGNHIDIYDEMLKRKENELFGTNHVKQTNRHRNMCEKWENHHERLAKLKEEWENDTSTSGNTHPSDSNKTLNTDVSIQIDMNNPKTTNEFTYVDSNPNQVDDTYVDRFPF
ncbi:erythrocyte membrane protein 1 [Plasmodium falciparum IGH-CR14]|uniref:Erythrocyte membrane protein 1 n=1 Tax=Plasmodium falciparum IGH-CR14 TaxID=580059 RepID=A0A0L1I931_PLAFA|nr:erythrocyte membrane protein 1 [Plasmodium falciparum IGH-CR14]